MRNLVFQYFFPYNEFPVYNTSGMGVMPKWAQIGIDSAQRYAWNIGAEYMLASKPWNDKLPINQFETMRLIYDPMFDYYDNILCLDVDLICNTKENIFELAGPEVTMVHEKGVWDAKKNWINPYIYGSEAERGWLALGRKYYDPDLKLPNSKMYKHEKRWCNGGVVVWTKEARHKAREAFTGDSHYLKYREFTNRSEQPYLNLMFNIHKFDVHELTADWNNVNFNWEAPNRPSGKFIHFIHNTKKYMEQLA